jgi:hypothetical protein
MGIAELATRLLNEDEADQRQPAMGEGDVRTQLYGESLASHNVRSQARSGGNRHGGGDAPSDPGDEEGAAPG